MMTGIEGLLPLIGTYGFPIAVTLYLLWERKNRDDNFIKEIAIVIKSNTEALGAIREVIKECTKK